MLPAKSKPAINMETVDSGNGSRQGNLFWALIERYQNLNLALLDQALVSGTNFITGILLARFLGIEEFGRFTLVWMVVLFVNMVQQALILLPMMSLGPKQSETYSAPYFGSVAMQQVILCILFCSLTVVLGFGIHYRFPDWQVPSLIMPLLAVIIAFQAQEFIRRYFFTHQRIGDAFLNDAISYGGQLILLLGMFTVIQLETAKVLWIIALTSALAVIMGLIRINPLQWRLRSDFFKQTTRRHWHFSKWLIAGSVMQWIGGQFFVVASGALLSVAAVGAIGAARNVLGLTLILFAAVENVVSVRASLCFKQGGWPSLRRYIAKVSLYGGIASGLICLTAAIFAPMLMTILFGEAYQEYAYLVYWFAGTHFLMFFIRPLSSLLRSVEHTNPIARASILPMILSLAASVPLIKMMGLTGAMVVMLGTQMLLLIYLAGTVALRQKEQR